MFDGATSLSFLVWPLLNNLIALSSSSPAKGPDRCDARRPDRSEEAEENGRERDAERRPQVGQNGLYFTFDQKETRKKFFNF